MSCKKFIFLFVFLTIFILYPHSIYSQTNDCNYSIKNRWTAKTSVSRYKTAFWGNVIAFVGDNFCTTQQRKITNFKLEYNHGINKFIETGIFAGFQHYEWINDYSSLYVSFKNFAPLL